MGAIPPRQYLLDAIGDSRKGEPVLRVALVVAITFSLGTFVAEAHAQQRSPFGTRPPDSAPAGPGTASADSVPLSGEVDPRLGALDSTVYRLAPSSRLQVKTGKSGLFGFAGHSHMIQARAFRGEVVYHPRDPSHSRLDITVITDSLEVLTPPDTAEIRKVTAEMRTSVLRISEFHEIRLVSRHVTPTKSGFHIVAALTMVGQTREVPIDVTVRIGLDTLEAASAFSVKQTDFGIKPFSGGPGGSVKVADRVTFDIRAIALRTPAE